MRYDHIPVDQRVGGQAREAVVEPRLLHLQFAPGVGPGPRPSRLVHFRRGNVAGLPPDPSEQVSEAVVSADDQTADQASQGVETVSVEELGALPALAPHRLLFRRVPAPLVAAPVRASPEVQRDPQP